MRKGDATHLKIAARNAPPAIETQGEEGDQLGTNTGFFVTYFMFMITVESSAFPYFWLGASMPSGRGMAGGFSSGRVVFTVLGVHTFSINISVNNNIGCT